MTNADKIRQMSDEELATKLCVSICNMIPWSICDQHTDTSECDKCMLDWLKQEVQENGWLHRLFLCQRRTARGRYKRMMLLLLMLGIKLNMGPMYFLIWFVAFMLRLLGDGRER